MPAIPEQSLILLIHPDTVQVSTSHRLLGRFLGGALGGQQRAKRTHVHRQIHTGAFAGAREHRGLHLRLKLREGNGIHRLVAAFSRAWQSEGRGGLDPAGRPSFCNDLRTDPALASLLHRQPMVQPSKLCHLVLSSGLVESLVPEQGYRRYHILLMPSGKPCGSSIQTPVSYLIALAPFHPGLGYAWTQPWSISDSALAGRPVCTCCIHACSFDPCGCTLRFKLVRVNYPSLPPQRLPDELRSQRSSAAQGVTK